MVIRASRGNCLGWLGIVLSLAASVVLGWRKSIWTGILAFPTTFVLLVIMFFAVSAGIHAYRRYRNPTIRACFACGAPVRYRDGTMCNNCGTDNPGPRA